MMKKTSLTSGAKLRLHRETLRSLNAKELIEVRGAAAAPEPDPQQTVATKDLEVVCTNTVVPTVVIGECLPDYPEM